jgi:hypothetical protein
MGVRAHGARSCYGATGTGGFVRIAHALAIEGPEWGVRAHSARYAGCAERSDGCH